MFVFLYEDSDNMNKNYSILAILLALTLAACGQTGSTAMNGGSYSEIDELPRESISQEERADLLLLRQEESLAGDLYSAFHEDYNPRIFQNIARSEDQHTGAVKALLDKYEIDDPVQGDGQYSDPELQEAFEDLQRQGQQSYVAALQAAAYLEERDIRDLNNALNRTDNEDISQVYTSLRKGSANHLKAFQRQLSRQSATYELQYISQEQIETYSERRVTDVFA